MTQQKRIDETAADFFFFRGSRESPTFFKEKNTYVTSLKICSLMHGEDR
jgi:hypothetical protein